MIITFVKDVQNLGGSYLINRYTSLSQLLSEVYPDYEWLPWKFDKCPNGYWDDVNNQRKFMDWTAKQLNVNSVGDWVKVSYKVS
jgi:hypothetical protein